jgi:carboxypeptidase Taq
VRSVTGRGAPADDSCLRGNFPVERQRALAKSLLRALPLPPDMWRLDDTAHPFASAFATTDIRITTRYDEHHIASSIFCALHEFGHGLYENGVGEALARTPLGKPASLGLHESQSRTWENLVGRSLPFWRCFFAHVQSAFPSQFAGVGAEEFHRAVNRVEPSLIRVEADELTYDLHVLLRFELEREIVGGELALEDLPEVWNERMRSYLGVEVPNDADGVLQDVHWAGGSFGYFPTYTLGNVIASQLWEAARAALPALDTQLEHGELAQLREWLREHVHRHGRKLSAQELVQNVTGGPIEVGPYMRYLHDKFAE